MSWRHLGRKNTGGLAVVEGKKTEDRHLLGVIYVRSRLGLFSLDYFHGLLKKGYSVNFLSAKANDCIRGCKSGEFIACMFCICILDQ